jgi:F-type H+-transporting ATPase subunit b
LNTIRNSEELCKGAIDQLEKARKEDLINAASENLEQLEDPKNETVYSEQQRAIDQIRQQVSRQALRRAIGTLNSRLNTELHLRTIDHNIGLLRTMMNTSD